MAWCWRSAKAEAITWTNVDLLQLDSYNQTSMKFDGKYKHFYLNFFFLNAVGKMGAILFRQ